MRRRAVWSVVLVCAIALGQTACRRPAPGTDLVQGPAGAFGGATDWSGASPTPLRGAPAEGLTGPLELAAGAVTAMAPTAAAGSPDAAGDPPGGTAAANPAAPSAPTGAVALGAADTEPVQPAGPALPPPPRQPVRQIERAASNVTTSGGVVESPAEGAAIASGPLVIRLSAQDSPHYLAQIDAHLTRLVKAGEEARIEGLKPGPHVLRVIPCDEHGVTSLSAAQAVRTFTIGASAQPVPGFSPNGPILNIGRPFGTVKADDIGAVLMDIRVDGVKLSESGTLLKYKLDSEADEDAAAVSEYPPKRPVQLFDLAPGPHKLTAWLELDGRRIENGGVTRVEREFTVAP